MRPAGVAVRECTKPKQTDTTQRWKVGLEAPGRPALIRTKIEFSHREIREGYRLAVIPGELSV